MSTYRRKHPRGSRLRHQTSNYTDNQAPVSFPRRKDLSRQHKRQQYQREQHKNIRSGNAGGKDTDYVNGLG